MRKRSPQNRRDVPFIFFPFPKRLIQGSYWLEMTAHELRVYMYICYKTWGFGKDRDKIALSQFWKGTPYATDPNRFYDKGCGLGLTNIKRALKTLEDKHLVRVKRHSRDANEYEIRLDLVDIRGVHEQENGGHTGCPTSETYGVSTQENKEKEPENLPIDKGRRAFLEALSALRSSAPPPLVTFSDLAARNRSE